jgi:hypothetical protein
LLKARTESWRSFTAEQVSPKQAAWLNKILQRKAFNKLGLLTKEDGSLTNNIQESHSMLMKEHFPGSRVIQMTTDTRGNYQIHWEQQAALSTQYWLTSGRGLIWQPWTLLSNSSEINVQDPMD